MMSATVRWQDLILPVGIISSVLVILVPLPPAFLDVLLAANITVAVLVLLTTIHVRTPLEFSVFPSLLLATTLARLVLNVASTRLILTRAESDGMLAAGGVIKSFGEFVTGDRLVVGLIIFVIIIVIQFVVITKGATRISEVAARFALDGMPGRQMAIDADLSAGLIDEAEARRRRDEITRQADFYGAMDGASKFVRGDAIAGLVITMVNIGGGIFVGMAEAGMSLSQAAALFTKLTIGDGLVSQVPAFLISLAAGLLVTRSTQRVNLAAEFLQQLFSRPQTLAVAGCFVGVLVLTNLPTLPLLTIGGGCVGLAIMLSRQKRMERAQGAAQSRAASQQPKGTEDRIEDYLRIDPVEIEIGVGLIRLADPNRGGDLLPRITEVRQVLAGDIGIVLPKVRIRDNLRLNEQQFRIRIGNNPVAEGTLQPGKLLATGRGQIGGEIQGAADGLLEQPAVWIDSDLRQRAEQLGYTIVKPAAVLASHLQQVVRRHADELLTRDATKYLIDELKKTSPAVVEELIPAVMQLSEIQQILQMLLREDVPVRQLGLILEAMGDGAARTRNPIELTEYVRQRLARTICTRYRDEQRTLYVMTLDPLWEERVALAIHHDPSGSSLDMLPDESRELCEAIAAERSALVRAGHPPVLLVSPQIRPYVKRLTSTSLPQLIVLSFNEITRDTQTQSVATVGSESYA
jgi:flagellar biosynthesis protein FlhA